MHCTIVRFTMPACVRFFSTLCVAVRVPGKQFRQADTGLEVPNSKVTGSFLRNVSVAQSKGAAGECGTQCTTEPRCKSWSYTPNGQTCTLSTAPLSGDNMAPDMMSTAGRTGDLTKACSMNWTSLPEMFHKQG